MTAISFYPIAAIPSWAWQQCRRIGPLGVIVFLHLLFFYALQSGLLRQAAQAMPREIFVSLIAPAPKPAPKPEVAKPPAAKPKTVPVIKKPVKTPPPVARTAKPEALPQPVEMPVAAAAPSIEPPAPAAPIVQAAPPAPAVSVPMPMPMPPKTVSGVEYVQAPQPDYPPIARRMREEGKVILRVLINEKGRPERIDVRQSSGSARLDESARQAAARALFKPHVEDGKAVAVYVLVPINFSIQ